jgi:hypothetical protein
MSKGTLNLYPIFLRDVRAKHKTSSVRLGNKLKDYLEGDLVILTSGWDAESAVQVARVEITKVFCVRLGKVDDADLFPDECFPLTRYALRYTLGLIYKRAVCDADYVTIVKWRYVDA